jgi:hypothetical protein
VLTWARARRAADAGLVRFRRHAAALDLQLLNDAEVIRLPVNQWPCRAPQCSMRSPTQRTLRDESA